MKKHLFLFGGLAGLAVFLLSPVSAQLPPVAFDEGPVGLGVALRRLDTTASVLFITAHPDDEDNALLVALSRGRGVRTGMLTLTRGDGGQNEIGPELFEALGIIRTEELMSLHRYDGAEQFFTRAYEFGYSFSVEETLEKWHREQTLGDIVAVIRSFQPDVILTLPRRGTGGGQHHQTSAILATEAFRAAADPDRFRDHPAAGRLRPWQADRIYERYRWDGGGGGVEPDDDRPVLRMETGVFDPLLGHTWAEIGTLARGFHRCQGMAQLTGLPAPRTSTWKLVDSAGDPALASEIFNGIDTSLSRITSLAGGGSSGPIADLVTAIGRAVGEARSAFSLDRPEATAAPLARGLGFVRDLGGRVSRSPLLEMPRTTIVSLLDHKEAEFERALGLARQLRLQALSSDGTVVAGQRFAVEVNAAHSGGASFELLGIELVGDGWGATRRETESAALGTGRTVQQLWEVDVPAKAPITQPYWYRESEADNRFEMRDPAAFGRPWSPPPLVARLKYRSHGVESTLSRPVQFRYPGPWVGGEQRHTLMVVPAISVSIDPGIQILPAAQAGAGFRVRVTSAYNGTEATSATVRLRLPTGWRSEPDRAAVEFARSEENRTVSFDVRPPASAAAGRYRLTAMASLGDQVFSTGHQFIDYDHIEKRVLYHPAATEVEVLEVAVARDLRIGYIDGVGDHVPAALEQLGLKIEFLDEEALSGDLSRFDTIVTGVRAYLVRDDLKAHNQRLLDWVEAGGTLIVQYNKFEFNGPDRRAEASPYAPLPALVGRGRVTDETAPIRLLEPRHPVFSAPNRIDDSDWDGWVQERGLYFLGDKDPGYQDLVVTADPFEYNEGDKLGSLVELRHGEGRWIYVGLGLWRQLPAGVPGAYRLLANLVSLGKTAEE